MRVAPVFPTSPEEPARQFNVEFRVADGSSCPYLALGAIVWAGVDGLRRNLALPAEDAETHLLPRSLEEALAALEADELAAGWWSSEAMSAYLAFKRAEIKALEGSPRKRYARAMRQSIDDERPEQENRPAMACTLKAEEAGWRTA